ncbi:hypothetical protein K402DRAFT_416024 [Aulographum hederae CBS 113979]|uniref:LITAF domain-containing protein n=1 Tax=Aulographum hederae CBS 113979 TaxID=1176131 RepID=A0A6G1HH47_9PEZI|nr:hypothetical protein K402DRAFT_416024 [Aulographum hederae CBS 113979]
MQNTTSTETALSSEVDRQSNEQNGEQGEVLASQHPVVTTPEAPASTAETETPMPLQADSTPEQPPPAYSSAVTPLPKPYPQTQAQAQPELKPKVPTPLTSLGEVPAYIECPHCHHLGSTKTTEHNSDQTALAGILCCLFCGIIGACIPFACQWCSDVEHTCENCKKVVALKGYDEPVKVSGPVVGGVGVERVEGKVALPDGMGNGVGNGRVVEKTRMERYEMGVDGGEVGVIGVQGRVGDASATPGPTQEDTRDARALEEGRPRSENEPKQNGK